MTLHKSERDVDKKKVTRIVKWAEQKRGDMKLYHNFCVMYGITNDNRSTCQSKQIPHLEEEETFRQLSCRILDSQIVLNFWFQDISEASLGKY